MCAVKSILNFVHDEHGAITVDWVVLTAAIVGIGVAVATSVGTGTTEVADNIGSHMSAIEVSGGSDGSSKDCTATIGAGGYNSTTC